MKSKARVMMESNGSSLWVSDESNQHQTHRDRTSIYHHRFNVHSPIILGPP